jgi:hypothetical protein
VDVKYVLGGREKNVELIYVRPYVELDRGGRERRRDVKMNVDTLGGAAQKKKKRGSNNSNNDDEDKAAASTKKGRRTALSFIDGNGGKQQHGTTIATAAVAAVAAVAGDGNTTTTGTTTKVDNDSWTLIKVSVVRVCVLTPSPCIYIIISLFAFSPSFISHLLLINTSNIS